MNPILFGLREGGLTIAYNLFLTARALSRRLTAPVTVGVRVIVPLGDRVLLVRHRGGRFPWSLPGGGISCGEGPAEAALRELDEEASCAARVSHLHGLFHNLAGGKSDLIAAFVCLPLSEAHPPVGDLEIVDARFFLARDLPATIDPGSRRRIEEHGRGERGHYGPW